MTGFLCFCKTRKFFRLQKDMVEEFGGMVKLNNRQIAWIVKSVSLGKVKTKEAAQIYG